MPKMRVKAVFPFPARTSLCCVTRRLGQLGQYQGQTLWQGLWPTSIVVSVRGFLGSRCQQMGMDSGKEEGKKWTDTIVNTNKSFGDSQKYLRGVLVNGGAITKYHRLGGLNNKHFFGRFSSWGEPLPG